MAEPSLALHKAIYAALVAGLSVSVYDEVPQGAGFPYVTIDSSIANNADFLTARKQERFVFLTVWTEYQGQEQVLSVFGEIYAALHNTSLALDTGSVVFVSVDETSTQRDADNVTFNGRATLRIMTEN